MKQAKYLRFILATLLPVGSQAGEDALPPADSLSEEDFDKEFEKMMNTPVEEEEDTTPSEEDSIEPDPEPEETEAEPEEPGDETAETAEEEAEPEEDSAEEVEQQEDDSEEDSKAEVDTAEEDQPEDETNDSTNDETKEVFDFSSIPMDEIIPMDIPANGMKVKATMNELVEGFKKGMNYTQKMQELAPLRKSMSIVSSNNISEEQLNLLVEAQKGNKEAISKLISASGVDPLDIEAGEHKDYTPADYSKDEVDVDMDLVRKDIVADTEYGDYVQDAIKTMPEDMYEVVASGSGNLKALHDDVKAGIYQEVMPEVMKLQSLYGKKEPTMDTYLKVANQRLEQKRAEAPAPEQKEETVVKQTKRNEQRKRVAPSARPNKKESFIQKDLDSLGEDEFEAEFAKITGRSINDYK